MNNKEKGNLGEKIAKEYLLKSGYEILETNFRYSRFSEIDIIAKEKETIVFVEVKARTSVNFGHPFEAVNKKKMQNIYQTALYYLQKNNIESKKYRIDVISILGMDSHRIEHLKNVSLF